MSELSIHTEVKPPLEQALLSDLPDERCPLVVVNAQAKDSATVVVLNDTPETFVAQTEAAMPNVAPVIKHARKLLALEYDPACNVELSGLIGRSEDKVAIMVLGETAMSDLLRHKLGTLRLDAAPRRV